MAPKLSAKIREKERASEGGELYNRTKERKTQYTYIALAAA